MKGGVFVTKQEVLQGALALNGDDKKFTITVEDDKIIIETKYYGTPKRKATFRFIARLRDGNTYTETFLIVTDIVCNMETLKKRKNLFRLHLVVRMTIWKLKKTRLILRLAKMF